MIYAPARTPVAAAALLSTLPDRRKRHATADVQNGESSIERRA
jgi:hypothetical protein